ncbi:hypothetical protein [Solibacillus sp. R5-41]|nr:hypothetical protein [Solibacillus sp. R5-41]
MNWYMQDFTDLMGFTILAVSVVLKDSNTRLGYLTGIIGAC